MHFLNGIVFGLLYGILFRELVGWKRTNGGNIAMGLLYALIMTIISAGLLVPYAYVPNQGYGFFLFDGPVALFTKAMETPTTKSSTTNRPSSETRNRPVDSLTSHERAPQRAFT